TIGFISLARIDFSRGSRGVIACIRRWRRRRRVIGSSFCRLPGTALSLASLVGANPVRTGLIGAGLVSAGIVDDAVSRYIVAGRGRRRSPVCGGLLAAGVFVAHWFPSSVESDTLPTVPAEGTFTPLFTESSADA